MDWTLLWTGVGAVAALGAAALAWAQAREARSARSEALEAQVEARLARDAAQTARDDANRIASEARQELARSASALERANEIAESSRPRPIVKWEVSRIDRDKYVAVNVGMLIAENARIEQAGGHVFALQDGVQDISPGDSLSFAVARPGGTTPRVRMKWDGGSVELNIP
ncbi:MAG: hypothetical protein P0Y48_01400 [Candidatus Microbacterium phytovorans]|uniref:Uncharacterized protein n=1 Tax=Candidatus Microbacterium phytovorans TaxID=3121374 RepID=A0AAJ6B5K2_9MICO|nr:hypothetical protein [Microbacterium sp.]WEK13896.1 MAG: hypothetical protein P0Y48_01400 [Microbacterium sp.]